MNSFFFFNDTATTEIYTLSLHDALPISPLDRSVRSPVRLGGLGSRRRRRPGGGLDQALVFLTQQQDRKSTRLNSSHDQISYAVFCLKKKKQMPTRGEDASGKSWLPDRYA